MTKRIFRAICIVALVVYFASLVLFMGVLYSYFSGVWKKQLKVQTGLASQGVEAEGAKFFDGLDTGNYRITWIASDGEVLFDTDKNSTEMENHMEREEVKKAFEDGYGESSRYSSTLTERSLYAAQKLNDGTVVRVSVAQRSVLTLMLGMTQPVLIVFILAVALSLALASRISKNIVKPLNEINLDEPLSNEGYDEISPLLKRIDSQQKELKIQSAELARRREEFEAVTKSMNEGLVLLNRKGTVISLNRAAGEFLNTDEGCIGQNILVVNRSRRIQEILSKALEGSREEAIAEFPAGIYQFDASPVYSDGEVSGAVLLIFDVTEKEKSEAMRREFTANVSHELKTPLHSISGYAELIVNGIAKDGDIKAFSAKIYNEAQRMILLVEDIIRLSRLDEGAEDMRREAVELLAAAEEVKRSLQPEAENAGIEVSVIGESAVINGIRQLINGIIFNLCDNAIKYNRPNGTVVIEVKSGDSEAAVTVKDTGIGIPPEHQGRIFERFYRVDKSHSKEVGGTGLGLSIVKHAAKIHNARIELKSALGEGTEITVYFPVGNDAPI